MLCGLPIPSFVVQICGLFPPPARIELGRQCRLPGSFPQECHDELAIQKTEEDSFGAAQNDETASAAVALRRVPSAPPDFAEAVIDKHRADYIEWRISEMTAQNIRRHFYNESDFHRAIRTAYNADFVPKTPIKFVRKPRTILRKGPRQITRYNPKRLALTRPSRAVRCTNKRISPHPGTHTGLDVPGLLGIDTERKSPDDPFFAVGREHSFHVSSDNSIRLTRSLGASWHADDAWYKPEKKFETPELDLPIFYDTEKRGNVREWTARVKAEAPARIHELVNAPALEGLANEPIEEILQRLVKKGQVDTTHRDRYRAARQEAAEQAEKKAEEEARRLVEDACRRAEEAAKRLAEEEAKRLAEEEELAAERREAEQKLTEESFSVARGLRLPRRPLVFPPSKVWIDLAHSTLRATASRTLAKTSEGSDLRRHDFATVVPSTQWLNDEIINGSLLWMDKAINEAAGIEDVRRQTRKCLTLNSFFFKDLLNKGPCGTERKLRRCGVNKNNFLDVETVLLPICDRSHWTMLVVRPGRRCVMHLDSLNSQGSSAFTTLTLLWLKEVLQEKFVASEWTVVKEQIPVQMNGHDCGVFAITNAICLALGLSPVHSYTAADMPMQRIRIACMLLNGGFSGDFDLGVH
ncbi:hypothetical protein XA68_10964 [Ophiocordyceps unilateralis]|uniref:Ubiquitin-like protease family profile domain-containing protein n=1 Tax=Ophiocordyceps unilateralis TaxID=268505 RepID=A0A2A9NYH7_OPHUN|nr:hypothetical protein XA68_10964 [Ophiocordyceps unilateralis]